MFIDLALIVVGLSTVLVTFRVLIGPTWGDRIMAFDFLSVNMALLFVLLALRFGYHDFLDAALVLALLGFLSTVALARFMLFGRVMK